MSEEIQHLNEQIKKARSEQKSLQSDWESLLKKEASLKQELEILEAKKNRRPIIVLEYAGCGSSYEFIYDLLRHYPKFASKTKRDDDGSEEVLEAVSELGIREPKIYRVCGVNTNYCVADTAYGLSRLTQADIILNLNACHASEWDMDLGTLGRTKLMGNFHYSGMYL